MTLRMLGFFILDTYRYETCENYSRNKAGNEGAYIRRCICIDIAQPHKRRRYLWFWLPINQILVSQSCCFCHSERCMLLACNFVFYLIFVATFLVVGIWSLESEGDSRHNEFGRLFSEAGRSVHARMRMTNFDSSGMCQHFPCIHLFRFLKGRSLDCHNYVTQ
jgi:hypothetical protein